MLKVFRSMLEKYIELILKWRVYPFCKGWFFMTVSVFSMKNYQEETNIKWMNNTNNVKNMNEVIKSVNRSNFFAIKSRLYFHQSANRFSSKYRKRNKHQKSIMNEMSLLAQHWSKSYLIKLLKWCLKTVKFICLNFFFLQSIQWTIKSCGNTRRENRNLNPHIYTT